MPQGRCQDASTILKLNSASVLLSQAKWITVLTLLLRSNQVHSTARLINDALDPYSARASPQAGIHIPNSPKVQNTHLDHLCLAECRFKYACLQIVHHFAVYQVQPTLCKNFLVLLALCCVVESTQLSNKLRGILQQK
eukprot:GHRR01034857.1.p1 GENE.GHRR01034857.1~~GHRR01034857.1.p1  ORF type:complete len:138 (+),score=4.45 GHRR01034857.1:277-690(+)